MLRPGSLSTVKVHPGNGLLDGNFRRF